MKKISILLAGCLALAVQSASAQDFARPGAYAALNGVTAIETIGGDDTTEVGVGVSGRLGYRFAPRFAVEAQTDWSGDFADGPFDLTSTTVTANAKFFLATQQIQPYLLAGIGAQIADTNVGPSDSAFAAKVGGGLDFYVNERFGLLGEVAYTIPTGDLDGLDYVSLGWGAFYRF